MNNAEFHEHLRAHIAADPRAYFGNVNVNDLYHRNAPSTHVRIVPNLTLGISIKMIIL